MFSYNIPLKTNDHKHQENDKGRFEKTEASRDWDSTSQRDNRESCSCTDSISCMKV